MKEDILIRILKNCVLCEGMTDLEIGDFIHSNDSRVRHYDLEESLFTVTSRPSRIYVLLSGEVTVCRDTLSGRRILITKITDPGDVFGEVYLYKKLKKYDVDAIATAPCDVLELPAFDFTNQKNQLVIGNLITLFANKAFTMNAKLRMISSGSLRECLVHYIINQESENGTVTIDMTREEFADYLNVTRPSLSRELMNMQRDGLITVSGRNIQVASQELLEDYL
jgi:CRP-like cAMP-binding protein